MLKCQLHRKTININFPSRTLRFELFGVFESPFHFTAPDTVIVSPCFLFLMTSAILVTGRAAGGSYLKGTDIVEMYLMTVLLCMYTMPLDARQRLVIVMGCSACCLSRNN